MVWSSYLLLYFSILYVYWFLLPDTCLILLSFRQIISLALLLNRAHLVHNLKNTHKKNTCWILSNIYCVENVQWWWCLGDIFQIVCVKCSLIIFIYLLWAILNDINRYQGRLIFTLLWLCIICFRRGMNSTNFYLID